MFYDSSDPSHSCLEQGWHKWSIGWTAAIWGMVTFCVFRTKKMPLWIVSLTIMLYGFGLIFFGPQTVLVNEVHWHLLALVAVFATEALYAVYNPTISEPSGGPSGDLGCGQSGAPSEEPEAPLTPFL